MKNHTVVKRYARALLELGKADGQYARYGQELKELTASFNGAGDIVKVLVSPVFPKGLCRNMLDRIIKGAGLSPLVANFIYLLMDKGRLADLPDIAEAYNVLSDAEKGVVRAQLTSATPLESKEVEAIRSSLSKFTGKTVELSLTEDPAIIGGLVAKLGDLTIDGSVRTQINKLSEQLDAL